jgi:uncharacterized protein (DUF58 family)
MPASKEYLPPEAIAAISSMELRAARIVNGYLSGMHRSPYFGQSLEFVQHRQYVPGDDLRHIDWKVWGRQDRLTIKQYEEDTNLRCSLLLDASSSMDYGRGPLSKFDYAATLAACLAYLCLRQQDAVGLSVFDDRLHLKLPWRSGRKQASSIYDALQKQSREGRTGLKDVFREVQQALPRRGLVVLLTDFLGSDDQSLRGLANLRAAGHDVVVFHVMDDDELDFPFNDPTRFEDVEGGGHLACNPRSLREGYLESLQRFLDAVRRSCGSFAADYHLVRTSHSIEAALTAFLAARMAHLRKR